MENMLLTIVDKTIESSMSLILTSEFQKSKSLVEYLFRFGIVIVHRCSWFLRTLCGLLPTLTSLFLLTKTIISNTKIIIEIIFLGSIKLSLTKMWRIHQTLLQQTDCLLVILGIDGLFCKFHTTDLILRGNLAFSSLPRMELMSIKFCHRLLVTSQLIEQSDFLQNKIITTGNKLWVFLQDIQTILMWTMQAFVKLIQFHQNTGICFVKVESLFHHLNSAFLSTLIKTS